MKDNALGYIEVAAMESGYYRSPNKETMWYAGSPGIPEMPRIFEVHIELWDSRPVALYVHVYGQSQKALCMRFEDWESYLAYCKDQGTVSKSGLPAFSNAWD